MPASRKKHAYTLPALGEDFVESVQPALPLADTVKTVLPAVVHISTVIPATETREKGIAFGSGFVIDGNEGYIVTNHHVIADAKSILVSFPDEDSYYAKLVGSEPLTDIAVLKLKKQKGPVPEATLGDSELIKRGHSVIAIGNPFGLINTVTTGIVSGTHRSNDKSIFDDYIQTDAAINTGNSGGPLFNRAGQVIGMNTSIYANSSRTFAGVGFAIPSNQVRWAAQKLINEGEIRRSYMGVSIFPVTTALADKFGLAARAGVFAKHVGRGSPAWNAGLRSKDIILTLDGQEMNDTTVLRRTVAETEPGQIMEIDFWRKGERYRTQVQLGWAQYTPEDPDAAEMEEFAEAMLAREALKNEIRAEIMKDVLHMLGRNNNGTPKRGTHPYPPAWRFE